MTKQEFVYKLSELLTIAKPNLIKCEYVLGKDIVRDESDIAFDKHYIGNDEYIIVTCENGYSYKINVSCNSLAAIAEAVFSSMVYK